MITLIHGDDTVKSRADLTTLKQAASGKEVRELVGKSLRDSDLMQALSSSSLFGGDTVVIIEQLFSGLGKKIKRIQELATIIQENGKTVDIILWEDKEVGKTALSSLGSIQQRIYKIPTIIFTFLDSIQPGNSKQLLLLYKKLLEFEPPELVFAMLVKRIKQLMYIKSGKTPEGVQSWQLTRLTNQARPFTLERLLALYQKLKQTEYKRNTGQSVFDIKEATELIIISLC